MSTFNDYFGYFCAVLFYAVIIGLGLYIGARIGVALFPWPSKQVDEEERG